MSASSLFPIYRISRMAGIVNWCEWRSSVPIRLQECQLHPREYTNLARRGEDVLGQSDR